MTGWYYARGGEQKGPVELEKLVAAARAGKLRPDDLVWNDTMPNWAAASTLPEFQFGAPAVNAAVKPAAAAPVAVMPVASVAAAPVRAVPVAAQQVGYYSDQGGMPPHAAAAFKGFALPTGDIGVWPIDEAALAQWVEACKQRRFIYSAYGLFRGLCALTILGAVVIGISSIAAASGSRNSAPMLGFGIATVVLIGFSVLYGLAATAARKNQVWGPIAVTAVLGLSVGLQLIGIIVAIFAGGRDVVSSAVGGFLGMLVAFALLWVSARAIPAIKRFRACPAWCQELLIIGKH